MRKTCVKVLVLVKSREGGSPYGRGLSMLANEGVCLRPQQLRRDEPRLRVGLH